MLVRAPNSETTKLITAEPNDPYLDEIKAFVDACKSGDTSKIASTYNDAFETYLLTWAIRDAAEGRCASPNTKAPHVAHSEPV